MSDKAYEHMYKLDRPEFIAWYEDLVEIAKESKSNLDFSYKGLWVDFYDEGLTPEEAIEKKIQMS